ncbi:hypothetical protein [Moraxella lacunata]|uniref:hypothetical protein n=1 Tax=Moraxella lacunata TaxID=477 RepID=UPI003EE3845A
MIIIISIYQKPMVFYDSASNIPPMVWVNRATTKYFPKTSSKTLIAPFNSLEYCAI